MEPLYFFTRQLNPARDTNTQGGDPSFAKSSLQLNFATTVFDPATRSYVPNNVRAVRITGPGLPAAGVVLVPQTVPAGNLSILNKTGVVPAVATTSNNPQRDFRVSGVVLPSGAPFTSAAWPGSPINASAGNHAAHSDSPTTDMSRFQAFSLYRAEIYVGNATEPIVETSRTIAPLQSADSLARFPRHDLSPSAALITPPRPAQSSVTVQWLRNPAAPRLQRVSYLYRNSAGAAVQPAADVPDRLAVEQTSTSATINASIPEMFPNQFREIGLSGRTGRVVYADSIRYSPPNNF